MRNKQAIMEDLKSRKKFLKNPVLLDFALREIFLEVLIDIRDELREINRRG